MFLHILSHSINYSPRHPALLWVLPQALSAGAKAALLAPVLLRNSFLTRHLEAEFSKEEIPELAKEPTWPPRAEQPLQHILQAQGAHSAQQAAQAYGISQHTGLGLGWGMLQTEWKFPLGREIQEPGSCASETFVPAV